MSDRFLICVGIALGMVTLYVTVRMAMAMAEVKEGADKTISDVKAGPFGPVLGLLGLS